MFSFWDNSPISESGDALINVDNIFDQSSFKEYLPLALFGGKSIMDVIVLSMLFRSSDIFQPHTELDAHPNAVESEYWVNSGITTIQVPWQQNVRIKGYVTGAQTGDLWWEEDLRGTIALRNTETGTTMWSMSKDGPGTERVNTLLSLNKGTYQFFSVIPDSSRTKLKCTIMTE